MSTATLPVVARVIYARYFGRFGVRLSTRDDRERYGELGSRCTTWTFTFIRNPK